MQVEVKLDRTVTEPKVVILTSQITEEVNAIARMLSESEPKLITGFREDTVTVLDEQQILRIYAAGGKVYAVTPERGMKRNPGSGPPPCCSRESRPPSTRFPWASPSLNMTA